jgi:hypothetical protein
MRRIFTAVLTAMLLVTAIGPASGIVGGTVDGEQHPNVGILELVDLRPGGYIGLGSCSGTLIAPDKFLTAAHCLPGTNFFEDDLAADGYVIDELRISFKSSFAWGNDLLGPVPDITPYIKAKSWVANPGFQPPEDRGITYEQIANDLGVVTLSKNASSVFPLAKPALLPPAGYLVEAPKRDYTLVGYGLGISYPPLKEDRFFDATRRYASSKEDWKTDTLLALRGVPQSGSPEESGVTCEGDSGGPIFHGRYLVAPISAGDFQCHKYSFGARLDGPIARGFLARLGLAS